MKIDILTLFPEMFAPLDHSMIKRGREAGLLEITVTNIRDYATDKHQTTDERLYGGQRPKRTYNGMRYQSGYSDHLPLVASFRF